MKMIRILTSFQNKRYGLRRAGDTPILDDKAAEEIVRVGHGEFVETAALMPQAETRSKRGKGNYR